MQVKLIVLGHCAQHALDGQLLSVVISGYNWFVLGPLQVEALQASVASLMQMYNGGSLPAGGCWTRVQGD